MFVIVLAANGGTDEDRENNLSSIFLLTLRTPTFDYWPASLMFLPLSEHAMANLSSHSFLFCFVLFFGTNGKQIL